MRWSRTEFNLSRELVFRRLAGLPGAFCLQDEKDLFLGAFPCEQSSQIDPQDDEAGRPCCPEAEGWPCWIGVLPYEAFRQGERGRRAGRTRGGSVDGRLAPQLSQPIWQRYEAVARLRDEVVLIQGESEEAVARLRGVLLSGRELEDDDRAPAQLSWAEQPEEGHIHIRRVETALERISRGELYQVNLARRFRFSVSGDPISLLSALGSAAVAPFAAALDLGDLQVVSTSPELFLDMTKERVLSTRPVKGTRPRHPDPREDRRLRSELSASEKERAELAMVVDLERNDLGRLAQTGTVQMVTAPHVVSHPTVHHREAMVQARLRPDISRRAVLETMMPSGSITGAPKIAAMDLIAELEAHRRGLYTGALGYLCHGGGMRLSMAIRVLSIREGEGHYFTGGGIVADSDPVQELEETLWKAEQLRALVSI